MNGVSSGGPAERAGVKPGDIIARVAGKPVNDLVGFYRAVWAVGRPGTRVPLTVFTSDAELVDIDIESSDRYDWLKLGVSN